MTLQLLIQTQLVPTVSVMWKYIIYIYNQICFNNEFTVIEVRDKIPTSKNLLRDKGTTFSTVANNATDRRYPTDKNV